MNKSFFVGWLLVNNNWIKQYEHQVPSWIISQIHNSSFIGRWQIRKNNQPPLAAWILPLAKDEIHGIKEFNPISNKELMLC